MTTSIAPSARTIRATRRPVAATSLAVVLAAVFVGCSSAKTSAPSASTASSAAASVASQAASVAATSAAPSATTSASAPASATTAASAAPAPVSSVPAAADGVCKVLDPATIKAAIGLDVSDGRAAGADQCVWVATSTETSPQMVKMMQALAPLADGLSGGAATLDDATIQQAARQIVSVAIFAREPDDPTDSTDATDDSETPPTVPVPGVGKQAFIVQPSQAQGTGGSIALVELADGRAMLLQFLLAAPASQDGIASLMKTAAGRA
jgi:hypothetical protein